MDLLEILLQYEIKSKGFNNDVLKLLRIPKIYRLLRITKILRIVK
jgi:hypothetical protein